MLSASRLLGHFPQEPRQQRSIDTDDDADALDIVRSVNVTRGIVVAERVVWATGAAKRRGLLGRDHLDKHEGMYLVPCQWIHMFGMRFPIDVAFLGKDGRVLALHHGLAPNRLSRLVPFAEGVLEIASGVLRPPGPALATSSTLLDPE